MVALPTFTESASGLSRAPLQAVQGFIVRADLALGAVLDTADNSGYFWAFVIAGLSYISILGFVHLLMPRMTPLDDNLNYITK